MATSPGQWFRDARQYFVEVDAEARKITWPPQKEAMAGTAGVLIIVTIVAIVLGTVDFGLSRIIQWALQG